MVTLTLPAILVAIRAATDTENIPAPIMAAQTPRASAAAMIDGKDVVGDVKGFETEPGGPGSTYLLPSGA